MNDLTNFITKPYSLEELYKQILKIIEILYDSYIPIFVKNRKNKSVAKMSDAEIISIQLLIECLGKTQNSGYKFLQKNYPNLTNYVERSRFNRLVSSLFTVMKEIRTHIPKIENSVW